MAITIDGTAGTIAGVAVGGLPDGIVDGDMLAANAVTTGKILDATIASGDLASGVGGKTLQIVESTTDSQVSANAESWTDLLTLSITPVSSSSQLYVDTTFNVVVYTSNKPWSQSLCKFRIYDVTNTTELNSTVIGGNTGPSDFSNQWMQNDVSMKAKASSTGTSVRSFKVQGYSFSTWYTYRVFCDAVEYASSYTSNNVGMISILERA
jgi:hypothetical protein